LAFVAQSSICEKYATALGVSQVGLMQTVVTQIVRAEVSDPLVVLFFNGMVPRGSTNFLNNTAALNRLVGGLIAYFGRALGCNDPSFPVYTGEQDMKKLHAHMPIDQDAFARFTSIFIITLRKIGVQEADLSTINSLLNSFAVNIVNPTTICPKYSQALGISELDLMTAVITTVVKKELADPTILPFFNGQVPSGSTNFLTNTTEFKRLAGNLIAFFGGALGCTSPGFPRYRGNPDMKALHARMPITAAIFSNFNNNLVQALGDLGVSSADQVTIRRVLDTFSGAIVNH
jgi:truncated hemoglobin YjbI